MILMGADMKYMRNELQSAQLQLTERMAPSIPDNDNLPMYSEDRIQRPSGNGNRTSRFDSRNTSGVQRPLRPKFNLRTFGKDVEQYTIDEFISTMDDYVKPFDQDSDELKSLHQISYYWRSG